MARILGAKYFRNVDFFEAQPEGTPSKIWNSILAAKDLLRKGSRLIVGDGQQIDVWRSPWMPDLDSAYVETLVIPGKENLKVKDLMTEGCRILDRNKISSRFNDIDQQLILSLFP